jgi:photosystem II stability/assembly factor-like uncharacterized protein
MRSIFLLMLGVACTAAAQTSSTQTGPWQMEQSDTTASLRGVHAVGGGVVWASGTDGTVLRSEDSGFEWQSCAMPPDAEKLDFRAIWAWDANTAMVMSSGPGDLSRLYKTTDGCAHWTLQYTNPDKEGFWDALAFADPKDGYIFGDPVETPHWFPIKGQVKPDLRNRSDFQIFVTFHGGRDWLRQQEDIYDNVYAEPGAGAFAASNSSVFLLDHKFWFGTGGKPGAFVLLGDSYRNAAPSVICSFVPQPPDQIWVTHRAAVPLAGGADSAGIFSLFFRDAQHGIAVGGDYTKPDDRSGTAAWTSDGGEHWTSSTTPPGGYRSAVAYDATLKAWITVGPSGSDISRDDGRTWSAIEHAPADTPRVGEWNALSLPWVVGPDGRIAKLNPAMLPQATSPAEPEKPKVTSR